MQSTNPKQLRAELKDYLDLAAKEPIRIQRRAGDSFILLKEIAYEEMQQGNALYKALRQCIPSRKTGTNAVR